MFREKLWERKAKECLDKIDPLDSLAFDVSVARHSLEEDDTKRAKLWLDGNHAAGEFRKAVELKLLTRDEIIDIDRRLLIVWGAVETNPQLAMKEIAELQEICWIKAYLAFTKCVVLV